MRVNIRQRRRILNSSVAVLTAAALFGVPTGSRATAPAPDPHEVSIVNAPAPRATRPVTGLDGATSFAAPTITPANNDADDTLIRYMPAGDTVTSEAYVNLHTGVATPVPGHPNRVVTTPDRVVAFSAATG